MASLGRRARRTTDIWPGFVDALASLIMVIVFVLLVFVVGQFFLGQTLSGREAALSRLNQEIAQLAEQLNLERAANADLNRNIAQLTGELMSSAADRDRLSQQLAQVQENADQAARLSHDIKALQALREELEAELRALASRAGTAEGALAEERRLSEEARAQAALLNRQLEALQEEMRRIAAALEASEKLSTEQKAQIADLGKRLNSALASKVEELQKYRSEFFGRLRQVLGNQPGIRVDGDRFVFQSELLFPSGSADLEEAGQRQLTKLAATLRDISRQIPQDVNWVLRVDGHTDRVPINTARFASNWELSTARAISVVRYLIAQGVPAERLAAAGFGEFHPIDPTTTPDAFSRNRRIELRFDQR